ncbi:amino acid dehydrogenase [Pacificimonas flava]|uniref:Amino acid dehydrogenase n=2 Tax=Pacificimonas TaxID=1960290 RepID=A0A219B777_9SPHN|nr:MULTISPECIES: Glu/Leu/Phe/Val dehydrogenase dimerization domain-containing protein [Pacificimonas]MBZ6379119.1 Glu/Leu/Phe/Val dehydrogenase [Pacificimonas aurantium]OWV33649.1 amino acid dehydrogenase [Pacificimonas flava]
MSVFDLPSFDDHESVHVFDDAVTGMRAIIAVHSTHRGPAAGGCRYWHYADSEAALVDALRLSRGMSYKNALADLPVGGGKAVLVKRETWPKTEAYLEAFGRAVDSLGGRYITAEDIGMSDEDMAAIARQTKFVSGLPVDSSQAGGNPGPYTADGVFVGMRAAVRHKLGREGFKGVHVAIQGLGSVGRVLAELLAADGAKLTVADIDEGRAARLAGELRASVVSTEDILFTDADVVAPCALGAVLNEESIPRLNCAVIAGAANNQLQTPADGERLAEREILYAPDYVVNAGGIINVMAEYLGDGNADAVRARIAKIEGRTQKIFERADAEDLPTNEVADQMAREAIGRA